MALLPRDEKLLQTALRLGFVNHDQLSEVQTAIEQNQNPLAQYLVQNGYVNLQQLNMLLQHLPAEKAPGLTARKNFSEVSPFLSDKTAELGPIGEKTFDYGVIGDKTAELGPMGDKTFDYGVVGDKTAELGPMGDKTFDYGVVGDKTAELGPMGDKTFDYGNKTAELNCDPAAQYGITTDRTMQIDYQDIQQAKKEQTASQNLAPGGLMGPTISIGKTWGDYEIIDELGRGGMGVVYKARKQGTKRLVALKLMIGQGDGMHVRRFLREAKATAKLSHNNIVAIYEMGEQDSYPFFTMEYVEGTTFDHYIEDPQVTLEQKLEAIIKISRALHHAHEKKILHRDIKPSNILMTAEGRPVLTDFGLAKLLDSNSRLTNTGHALGTPFYMPPEQAKGDKNKIGPHSDVYSLGIVLYQVLAGQLPFTGDTLGDLYRKIVDQEPMPPSEHNPEVSPELQAVCLKAIEKSTTLRYATANAFAQDLGRYIRGQKVDAKKINIRIALRSTYRFFTSSTWLIMTNVLLIIAVAFFFLRPQITQKWKPQWQKAVHAYKENNFKKVLKELALVKNHPNAKAIEKFRLKIYHELLSNARKKFQNGDPEGALNDIETISRPNKNAIRLKIQILEHLERYEEMRLELARQYELTPTGKELAAMGKKALIWGHFRDAVLYYHAAEKKEKNRGYEKKKATALLLWGKYQKARNYYSQMEGKSLDLEITTGLAMCLYHQGLYSKALIKLENIPLTSLDTFWQTQVLFYQALSHWKMLEEELSKWDWLSNEKKQKSNVEKLKNIETLLARAQTLLERDFSEHKPDYLQSTLRHKLRIYALAVKIEQRDRELEAFNELRSVSNNRQFPQDLRIFMKLVMIRYLLREKKWEEARLISTEAIEENPSIAELYHMRALANFHSEGLNPAMKDLENSMALDKWNFIPLGNIYQIILPLMAQEEFDELVLNLMNRFIYKPMPAVPQLLFEHYRKKLHEEMVQQDENKVLQPFSESKIKFLLQKALTTKSKAVHQMTINLLSPHYHEATLNALLYKLEKKNLSSIQKERLENILTALKKQEQKDIKDHLQHLLLKHAVLNKEYYAVEIHRMGANGEKTLLQIVTDEQSRPLMRLLATRMLLLIQSPDAYDQLRSLAQSNKFPENLLARTALQDFGISISLPPDLESKLTASGAQSEFFKMLVALRLKPKENEFLARKLLMAKEEKVALAAAYNFRRYVRLPRSISRNEIDRRLIALMRSEDNQICVIANRAFWGFGDTGMDVSAGEASKFQRKYRQQNWKKYHGELLWTLKSKIPERKFAAIRSLVQDSYHAGYFRIPEIANTPSNKPTIEVLKRYFRESPEYFIRFWSAVVLSTLDDKKEVQKIVENSRTPFFIRLACTRGVHLSNRSSMGESASIALSLMQKKPATKSDLYFKQLMILSMGWNTSNKVFTTVDPGIKRSMLYMVEQIIHKQSTHPYIRRSAITAMVWAGNRSHISSLAKLVKDKKQNLHIRRAAIASLFALSVRFGHKNLDTWQKTIDKYPKELQKSAGYGCYEVVRSAMNISVYRRSKVEWSKGYDIYLKDFENQLTRIKQEQMDHWNLALQNAIKAFPQSRYYYELALIYHLSRSYQQSHKLAMYAYRFAKKEEKNEELPYQQARCLLLAGEADTMLGQSAKAIKHFEQSLNLYPFQEKAHAHIANIYWQGKNYQQAANHYYRAYLAKPASEYLINLAGCYVQLNQTINALNALRQCKERYSLKRSQLKHTSFIPIAHHPWIKQLPD